MTDAQIIKAIEGLSWQEKKTLAAEMDVTERTVYRWLELPPANVHVRAALEKALQSSGRGK